MAFDADKRNLPNLSLVGQYPLFVEAMNETINQNVIVNVSIIKFQRMIDKDQSKYTMDKYRNKVCKQSVADILITIVTIILAVLYGLLPSLVRVFIKTDQEMIPQDCSFLLWFCCVLLNTTLVCICIELCLITSKVSFNQLLKYMKYSTIILNRYRKNSDEDIFTPKTFEDCLPYLNLALRLLEFRRLSEATQG